MSTFRTPFLNAALISLVTLAPLAGCESAGPKTESAPAAEPRWHTYGDPIDIDNRADVSLAALKGDEQGVWVSGVITEVCNHQGCWLRMKDASSPAAGDLFVRTKDHAFFVPRNAHGHKVMVHGRCEFKEMPVDEQQHYAEEAGKSEAEIAKITRPRKMIVFHADSIMIEGPGLDVPVE